MVLNTFMGKEIRLVYICGIDHRSRKHNPFLEKRHMDKAHHPQHTILYWWSQPEEWMLVGSGRLVDFGLSYAAGSSSALSTLLSQRPDDNHAGFCVTELVVFLHAMESVPGEMRPTAFGSCGGSVTGGFRGENGWPFV